MTKTRFASRLPVSCEDRWRILVDLALWPSIAQARLPLGRWRPLWQRRPPLGANSFTASARRSFAPVREVPNRGRL
jgi:hypothetical protein